jgi:multiple sugar transport system substrate-binding protein
MEDDTMTNTGKPLSLNRRTFAGAAAVAGAGIVGAPSRVFAAPALAVRQEPVTIQFWGGEPEENGPGDMVAAFNESQAEYQAVYTRYVNDDTGNTQLDTALQGGTEIDVYQSYGVPRTSQRIGAGAALDLTELIAADPDIQAWTDSTEIFRYNGTLFSLPTVIDPYVTIANKRLLDEAGVTLPEAWTIDEFREMCAQLSSDTVFGTYSPPDQSTQILGANRWYNSDATASNFDDPAFRLTWETHRGMIDEGSSYPWTDVLARDLKVYQQGIYLTEQAALWVTSSFVLRYVNDLEEFPHDFVTVFGPVPTPTDATDPWTLGTIGNDILINPKSANIDAAWALLRFRLIDGADHYLKAGKMAAYPGQSIDEIVAGILGPDRETLYDVASYQTALTAADVARIPTDSVTVASAQIQQIVDQTVDQYLIAEITIDETIEQVRTQADDAIAQASAS